MRTMRFAAIAAALIIGGFLSLPASLAQSGDGPTAPDFTLTDLSGKTIKLSDYRGKVLFLNFWATWCPPCRAEIPDFVEAYSQEKANGLEILGVSVDTKGKAAVADFVEQYEINYPVVLESRQKTEKLVNDYQPGQNIPATIIIDKSGRVRHKEVGAVDKDTLLKHFRRLIAE